jgi:hypothetical protein
MSIVCLTVLVIGSVAASTRVLGIGWLGLGALALSVVILRTVQGWRSWTHLLQFVAASFVLGYAGGLAESGSTAGGLRLAFTASILMSALYWTGGDSRERDTAEPSAPPNMFRLWSLVVVVVVGTCLFIAYGMAHEGSPVVGALRLAYGLAVVVAVGGLILDSARWLRRRSRRSHLSSPD